MFLYMLSYKTTKPILDEVRNRGIPNLSAILIFRRTGYNSRYLNCCNFYDNNQLNVFDLNFSTNIYCMT